MIETIYNLFSRLGIPEKGHDKVLHAICGFIIGAVMMFFFKGTIYPVIAVVLAGAGKEAYDVIYKGYVRDGLPLDIAYKERFDFFDMFWTLAAGWIAIMIVGNTMYYLGA